MPPGDTEKPKPKPKASKKPLKGGLPLPNFLIIGAQRSATRWLRTNLEEHPEIYTSTVALSFFSNLTRMRRRGLKGYQHQFDAWSGEPLIGESSPSYLLLGNRPDQIALRIDAALPDVKLLAIVRQPVDRLHSAVLHHIKRGRLPADANVFKMIAEGDPDVDTLDLIGGGLYHRSLQPYQDVFGDRLLVLVHDDIRTDPARVYADALAHLGAKPGFEPSRLQKVLFSNRRSVKATGAKPTLEQTRALYMLFRSDVEELEAMTGRYLPEWDPGPPKRNWRSAFPNLDFDTMRRIGAEQDLGEPEPEPEVDRMRGGTRRRTPSTSGSTSRRPAR